MWTKLLPEAGGCNLMFLPSPRHASGRHAGAHGAPGHQQCTSRAPRRRNGAPGHGGAPSEPHASAHGAPSQRNCRSRGTFPTAACGGG